MTQSTIKVICKDCKKELRPEDVSDEDRYKFGKKKRSLGQQAKEAIDGYEEAICAVPSKPESLKLLIEDGEKLETEADICQYLVRILHAFEEETPLFTNLMRPLDGYEALAEFFMVAKKAEILAREEASGE